MLPSTLHCQRTSMVSASTQVEQAVVLGRIVEVAAVVGLRDVELVAAEHAGGVVDRLIDRVALVREDAVEALDVGIR